MKDHTGDRRGYFHFRSAWYGKPEYLQPGVVDVVSFGYYAPDQSGSGELSMAWYLVRDTPTPRLEVFNDGWHALSTFGDLLAILAEHDSENMTPEQFCKQLGSLGFIDLTPRQRKGYLSDRPPDAA